MATRGGRDSGSTLIISNADERSLLRKVRELKRAVAGRGSSRWRAVYRGLEQGLGRLAEQAGEAKDPLADVDLPYTRSDQVRDTVMMEVELETTREKLLADCVDAEGAAALAGRSRQLVERLRAQGRVLALREGRRWFYPRWQFDRDEPGGLLPGVAEAARHLYMSPAGTVLWMTSPKRALQGATPIEVLRRRETDRVIVLAAEHGKMP